MARVKPAPQAPTRRQPYRAARGSRSPPSDPPRPLPSSATPFRVQKKTSRKRQDPKQPPRKQQQQQQEEEGRQEQREQQGQQGVTTAAYPSPPLPPFLPLFSALNYPEPCDIPECPWCDWEYPLPVPSEDLSPSTDGAPSWDAAEWEEQLRDTLGPIVRRVPRDGAGLPPRDALWIPPLGRRPRPRAPTVRPWIREEQPSPEPSSSSSPSSSLSSSSSSSSPSLCDDDRGAPAFLRRYGRGGCLIAVPSKDSTTASPPTVQADEKGRLYPDPLAEAYVPGEVWWAYCLLDDYMCMESLRSEDPGYGSGEGARRPRPCITPLPPFSSAPPVPLAHQSPPPLPPRESRQQPSERPASVDLMLWLLYTELADWVYRRSLSDAETLTLPTMDEVTAYGAEWKGWVRAVHDAEQAATNEERQRGELGLVTKARRRMLDQKPVRPPRPAGWFWDEFGELRPCNPVISYSGIF